MEFADLREGAKVIVEGTVGRIYPDKSFKGKGGKIMFSRFFLFEVTKGAFQAPDGEVALEPSRIGAKIVFDNPPPSFEGKRAKLVGEVDSYQDQEGRRALKVSKLTLLDETEPVQKEPLSSSTSKPPQEYWDKRNLMMVWENANTGACQVVAAMIEVGFAKKEEIFGEKGLLLSTIKAIAKNTINMSGAEFPKSGEIEKAGDSE